MTSSVVCVAVGNKMKALGQVLLPPRPSVTAFNINNAQNVGQLTVDLLFYKSICQISANVFFSQKTCSDNDSYTMQVFNFSWM